MQCSWPTHMLLFLSILKTSKATIITASNNPEYNDSTNDPHVPVNLQRIHHVLDQENAKIENNLHVFKSQETDSVFDQKILQGLLGDIKIKDTGAMQKDKGLIVEKDQGAQTLELNRNTVTHELGNILTKQANVRPVSADHRDKTQASTSVHVRKTLEDALNVALMNLDKSFSRKDVQALGAGTIPWSTQKGQKFTGNSLQVLKRRSAEDFIVDTLINHDIRMSVKKNLEPLQDQPIKSAPTYVDENFDRDLEVDDEVNLHVEKYEGHSTEDEVPIEEGEPIEGSEEKMQNLKMDTEEEILFGDMEFEIGNARDAYYIHSPLGHRRARSQALRRHKLHSQGRQGHLAHVRKTRD